MKKYLLLIISMLCVSIGAWAEAVTVSTDSNGLTTVTCTDNGSSEVTVTGSFPAEGSISNIKVVGPFTTGVSDKIANALGSSFSSFTRLDLSEATGVTTSTLSTYSIVNWSKMGYIKHLILPKGASVPTAAQLKSNASGSLDPWDAMEYFVIPKSDGTCDIYLTESNLTSINDADIIIEDKSTSTVAVHLAEGEDETPATDATKTTIENYLKTQSYKLFVAPYTVSSCNVSINMDGTEAGQTLADLIATAKAAVIAGGETGICTLTVKGELTNNDLIALGGTNMTGATRIDLSNATLGSGVTIENIQLPTSLTSLILPKGLTVSVGLKSKLTAATNLQYAYSPSTGTTGVSPDTETISVADYVWVNSTGGLDLALTNESTLNNSKYVKVASDVALSETDITFSGRLPNVKYFDMRNANMDASLAAASFGSPNSTDYRIILPDNWSTEQMSTFAGHLGDVFWTMAAIYSYSGTTLKIYEATDTKYMSDALSNHRIVVDGTTAIEVVGPNLGTDLLTALNGADSDVKTITISASSINNLTFDNDNITTLNVTGLNLNTAELNVDGCAVLKNLNVTGSTISSVDASATSLEAVNLNGSTISNNVDLSGSGLKTLTTNSATWIQGDLHLESTASFTSFASTAKFGVNNATNGNIYLNASGVSTVDLQSVQFQNESSKIHIDSTVGEGDTPLTNLNAAGQLTIYIPTGFTRTRLHPYSSGTLDDNIAELAATGAFTLDDGCKIDYNATTGIATVTALHPGCLEALMKKNDNYGKFVDGAIFTFDASCKLNAADLAALAGKDRYGNFNWNYVDLYDLPASYTIGETTVNYADVITAAINILRAENWQYKGLLLPKAVTTLGTTLIQDRTEDATKVATCSQFIAYSGAINDQALTASYIYKAANDWGITHAERLGKMKAVMDLHPEIMSTTTNWSVSTNSPTPIDMSILPTSVTIKGNTVNTSKLETVNNDMVAGAIEPSIYAYPAYEGVMNTVTTYTGIGGTPDLEILKVTGPLSATDIASINSFEHGPRVFDISAATTTITKAMLESITNANIEYIILPAGMTKADVCEANYTTNLKNGNLKAVISSTSTNLVAYVNTPGSLAEARYLATGGSINNNLMFPTITGLQSVTLTGNLNAADIAANTTTHHVDASGHWVSGGANATSIALSGEQGTITTIDLKDAVFAPQTDMNFSYAGLGSIRNITLPTSKDMTLIPANCFKGIQSFVDLCIPYNYKHIDNAALHGTYCSHITTTDAAGSLIDNGPRTYTFSANLEEIGSKPSTKDANGVYSLSENVFPHDQGQTDVYVLAHKVPKCYAHAFPANMLYGWGGFKGAEFPYCREKYDNSSDGSKIFTVLHFPDKASFDATDDEKELSYDVMKRKYTDVTKIYTKKEQTGAVDANGDPIVWPTFSELRRAYNQGTCGIIWDDWKAHYDGNHEVVEGFDIPTAKNAVAAATNDGDNQDANHSTLIHVTDDDYDFADYEGWHQFSLSLATYVEPEHLNAQEREFKEGGWYTFCIPFDMTESQVYEMLGVPYSDARYTNKVYGNTIKKAGDPEGYERILPDIRTLESVTRTPGTNGTTNVIRFMMSKDLKTNPKVSGGYDFLSINNSETHTIEYQDCGTNVAGEKIVIKGGYPYYIKPYLPKNMIVKNLGKYVMTRYSDMFKQAASCANHDGTKEYLGTSGTDLATLWFAKPFEEHKIQALHNETGNTHYATHKDGDENSSNDKKYYYTFIGQFWDQKLPRYCYYTMEGSGDWYRLSSDKSYTWNAYKCVILCTQEVEDEHTTSGHFRNNENGHSNYPSVTTVGTQNDILNGTLKIEFLDGIDDYDFVNSARETMFIFDDDIVDVGDGSETTAIDTLDGERILPATGKVYNMNGQHVGNSLEGLSKGMYIMNGKKYVIK